MNVLLHKDLRELVRTRRILFPPILFIILGIMGPVFVRLLPVLLKSAQAQMQLTLPTTTPADGFLQFLSLVRQLGLLAVILLSMGLIAGERRDGTLAVLFVKPVSRMAYVWSRWLVNGALIGVAFVVGGAVAMLYTLLLLGRPPLATLVTLTALNVCYVLLVFSWTFFFSAMARGPGIAAGLSLIPFFLLPALGALWKPLGEWGPYGAAAASATALGGMNGPAAPLTTSAYASAGLDLALCAALVMGAYALLRKAEL
jgi:ABC-2 type transport system permease protein